MYRLRSKNLEGKTYMKRNRSLDIVFTPRSKVLFYPSCGYTNIRPETFDLDYDLFVFSDQIVENLKDNSIAKMGITQREQASFNLLVVSQKVV